MLTQSLSSARLQSSGYPVKDIEVEHLWPHNLCLLHHPRNFEKHDKPRMKRSEWVLWTRGKSDKIYAKDLGDP